MGKLVLIKNNLKQKTVLYEFFLIIPRMIDKNFQF